MVEVRVDGAWRLALGGTLTGIPAGCIVDAVRFDGVRVYPVSPPTKTLGGTLHVHATESAALFMAGYVEMTTA